MRRKGAGSRRISLLRLRLPLLPFAGVDGDLENPNNPIIASGEGRPPFPELTLATKDDVVDPKMFAGVPNVSPKEGESTSLLSRIG